MPTGRGSKRFGRKISPMQLAAQILEDALSGLPDEQSD